MRLRKEGMTKNDFGEFSHTGMTDLALLKFLVNFPSVIARKSASHQSMNFAESLQTL